jgi:methylenetetrahydrofolate dehydrogenase (NADP+)/methenyltetrahydrofolate cyclohydrolase
MKAQIIDGKLIARKILDRAKIKINALKTKLTLVIINASSDSASHAYIKTKIKFCDQVGVAHQVINYDKKVSTEHILDQIEKYNKDDKTTGIVVQLPLWDYLGTTKIIEAINPNKDVDGLTSDNLGKLFKGVECIEPATARGVIRILEECPTINKSAVIVNRSMLVGKPLMHLLLNKDYTVTVCHSKTTDLSLFTKSTDVLITATGKPGLITKNMVKSGAVVIDVGISRKGKNLRGDVHDEVYDVAGYITPVPGGVGLVTAATLVENVINCYLLSKKEA